MLHQLDIVKGAVSSKDLTPVLTHLRIKDGYISSTNGRMTIMTALPEMADMDIIVPADKFIRAIKACSKPVFKITPGGRLSIRGDRFRAVLPLLKDVPFPTPSVREGAAHSDDLFPVMKALLPFIGSDASRPWACGILLHKGMAYATNNVSLARMNAHWTGPTVNLPDFLIAEILRLGKEIEAIKTDGDFISMKLADDVFLYSSLLSAEWPNADKLFEGIDYSEITEVPEDLYQAIRDIMPFCPDKKFPKIIFTEDAVTTDQGEHEASVDFDHQLKHSIWRAEPMLALLEKSVAGKTFADFGKWPAPCPWTKENGVEGLIIGLSQ